MIYPIHAKSLSVNILNKTTLNSVFLIVFFEINSDYNWW